jgi:sugar O-acyltransferase (sialic acid O-acetyltransferase NeuD family)
MKVGGSSATYLIGSQAGYSRELASILQDATETEPVYIDNLAQPTGKSALWNLDFADVAQMNTRYLLCPSPPGIRWLIEEQMKPFGIAPRSALVHPSSSVDSSALIGEGTSVNRLVSIASGVSIGHHRQVNRNVSIGHDCVIEDYVTIGPGATIASGVVLGRGVFVGAGAIIIEGSEIGANSVVGAGSVVICSIPSLNVWAGNPARILKDSVSGFKGFSVA